jgi:hypothetical protein
MVNCGVALAGLVPLHHQLKDVPVATREKINVAMKTVRFAIPPPKKQRGGRKSLINGLVMVDQGIYIV